MATPLIASLMQKAGGTAGIMGGARDAASDKKNDADSKNLESIKKSSNKLSTGSFIRKLGVGLGVFGLLRMSKGLSAVVSSFFQILGAFVDVIVAPFLPMIFKGLGKLASFIPAVQVWAQGIYEKFISLEGTWKDKLLGMLRILFNNVLAPLLTKLGETIGAGIKSVFNAGVESTGQSLKNKFKSGVGSVLESGLASRFDPTSIGIHMALKNIDMGFAHDIFTRFMHGDHVERDRNKTSSFEGIGAPVR